MIKERHPDMTHSAFQKVSRETKDLILKMLIKDPINRITPDQIL